MNKKISIKKYFLIFKFEIMSTFQYVKNILIHMIGYVIHIFIFFNLWNYVYDDSVQLINGYSKAQMIWYVIITEIIWSATSGRSFCKRICNDVKTGNIAYNLNKPYSYICYIASSHLGETSIKTIIAIIFGIVLGILFLKEFPVISIIGIIIVLLSMLLAVVINTFSITFIGLFSFFIEDANPFYWLYSKIILILGTIFPIEFFPGVLQRIMVYTPIYVICYGPAKLFVDFSIIGAINIILAQLMYLFIVWLMCNVLYRKGVKKLNVNGG